MIDNILPYLAMAPFIFCVVMYFAIAIWEEPVAIIAIFSFLLVVLGFIWGATEVLK